MGRDMLGIGDAIDFILATQAAEEQKQLTEEALNRLYNMKNYDLSPEELRAFYQQIPQDVAYKQVEIDPRLRQQQMAALEALQAIAQNRVESQGEAQRQLARMQAEQMAAGREQGIQQQMASRGISGSGLEFALRGQAGQEAANRANQAGLQGAAQAALERLQSQQAYQQGLGNLRTQDTDLSARNADIINRFNAYNADRQLAARNYNTNLQNQLASANLSRKDRNEILRKNFESDRVERINRMLGEQRGDVGRAYQPIFNITDSFSRRFGGLMEQGIGGMGGEMGGAMGGGGMGGQIGSMIGQQAGGQIGQQQPGGYYMQQPSYNQPVSGWGQSNQFQVNPYWSNVRGEIV